MDLYPPWVDLVKFHEGWRAKPYRCPAGALTIGYGHTGTDVYEGMPPITKEEGEMLLQVDLHFHLGQAMAASPSLWGVSDPRRAAVGDFVFNVGMGNPTRIGYARSTFRKAVEAGDWAQAAHENGKWVRGGGIVLPGLVKRRGVTSGWLLAG